LYRIRTYDEVLEQVAALPEAALVSYAEALGVMELAPWNGEPAHEDNPKGALRQLVFGATGMGMVTYLILEDQRLVDVVLVTWLG
jgi:hypothetical protein